MMASTFCNLDIAFIKTMNICNIFGWKLFISFSVSSIHCFTHSLFHTFNVTKHGAGAYRLRFLEYIGAGVRLHIPSVCSSSTEFFAALAKKGFYIHQLVGVIFEHFLGFFFLSLQVTKTRKKSHTYLMRIRLSVGFTWHSGNNGGVYMIRIVFVHPMMPSSYFSRE